MESMENEDIRTMIMDYQHGMKKGSFVKKWNLTEHHYRKFLKKFNEHNILRYESQNEDVDDVFKQYVKEHEKIVEEVKDETRKTKKKTGKSKKLSVDNNMYY
jgi:hypothetical protein